MVRPMTLSLEQQRQRNQRTYRRLQEQINRTYPAGHFVGIVGGKIVAEAPTFRDLVTSLATIENDPDRRLVVQAGVEYPLEVIDL